ncbi:MAG: hypothetical protein JWQ76_4137 [Ramlibacter sp.]|nr:hypothetical protein [Ramlibacter sp.]
MSKNVKSLLRVRRSTLASAAALAFGAAAPAMANMVDNGYYQFGQFDGSADQTLALNDYALWITAPQLNTGWLAGTVVGVNYQALLSGSAAIGTPVIQTGNSIAALVGANQSASRIDLALLARGADGSDGAAIMTGQVRRDAASRALVAGSGVAIRLDGMPVADQVISANMLSASTTLNQSASTVEGVAPTGYASGRSGRVSTELDLAGNSYLPYGESVSSGATLDSRSTASVGITSAQVNSNAGQRAGSNAALLNGTVMISATPQGGGESQSRIASQLGITGNALSAQYTGNSASSQFAQAGSAPFAGSVVVSNLQANVEGYGYSGFQESGSGATANVAGTAVGADLRNGDGYRSELTGSLAITGNSVIAGSIGNSALARDASGAQAAGNSIVLAGGAAVQGGQSYRTNMAGVAGGMAGAEVQADLVVASVQGNRETGFVSEAAWNSVSAQIDHVAAGASVALNGNAIAAAATGNAAGNRIQVDASVLSASAAASNAQTNAWTEVTASNYAARIETSIGTSGRDVGGSISLSSNRLGASAGGNVGDTQVALAATRLSAGGSPAGAMATNWEGSLGGANGDATAVNAQANQGGSVTAQLAGGGIAATFADQWFSEGAQVGLQGASVSLKDNVLRSQAVGNDAGTGITLTATTAAPSAAVASMQSNSAQVNGEIAGMGVTLAAGRVLASSVALDGNVLAAAAAGNRADNRLTAQIGSVQAGGEGGGNSANRGYGSAIAGLAVVNAQSNDAAIDSRNVASGAMVRATIGSNDGWFPGGGGFSGYGWPSIAGSDVSASGNTASASSTGNQAANTLSLQAGSLGTGATGPMAALNSVQSGWTEGRSRAVAGGQGGLLIGVQFDGEVASSTMTVAGNTVSASNLGNTVANRLETVGTSYVPASGAPVYRQLRGDSYSGMVQNDFSLVNLQSDGGAGRSAKTKNVTMGIEDSTSWAPWDGVYDSTLTVAGNRNLAEARSNDAVNGISFGGFSALGAGAGLLNSQDSSSGASASADGRFRLRARDMEISGSTLSVADNVTQALAVANSADNSIVAQATSLQGSGQAAPWYGIEGGNGVASGAGFALGNVQSQSGQVDARAVSAARVNLDWSGVFGTTAGVTGNLVAAIGQGNSANNTLALAASTASAVTGAVTSVQNASGPVGARAEAPNDDGAFAVRGQALFGSQSTVANNTMRASAGQNEAFNQLSVSGSAINAAGRLNNLSAFIEGPIVSGGADFSVSNQQYGAGNVDAAATPGRIGVLVDGIFGGNLTVSGNQVAARAGVNTASNALTLAADGSLGAGGTVSNLQSTGTGAVTATIGSYESTTLVGVLPSALNGAAIAVTGNSLAAQAGGNSGANVLNATGATAAAGGATPSFAVLNSQSNAAAMNAAVRNATIGVTMNGYGYEGTGLNSASAAVLANSVTASGYGNMASNAIGLGLPQAGAGAATASLASRQVNTAAISANVSNVSIGIPGATANGSSAVVSGNSVSAQAIGNSVVNTISVK